MSATRRAVIDIGTNSVKLLVAEVSDAGIRPLTEQSAQTRLGSGFYETHQLRPEAIRRTAAAVTGFAAEAARWGVARPRVIATSAARDARNPEELASPIRAACGLEVEILTGEVEADWAFRGVASERELHGASLLIVDAGGGSTEFIAGRGAHAECRRSFRIGTVRLLERLRLPDPPGAADWSRCQDLIRDVFDREIVPVIDPALARLDRARLQLIGTSGTASLLACMEGRMATFDRERIDAARLTREAVRLRREQLWSLPLAERRRVPGLPEDRADVILTGAAIYEAVMATFGFPVLRVSTRGLRFAALREPGDDG